MEAKKQFKDYLEDFISTQPAGAQKYGIEMIGQLSEDSLEGGLSDKKTFKDLVDKNKKRGESVIQLKKELKLQLNLGIKVEMEHTKDKVIAKEIAMDHLWEDPKYYSKLKKIETKETLIRGKFHHSNSPKKTSKIEKPIVKLSYQNKKENKEATASSSAGPYVGKALFSEEKVEAKEATTSASVGSYSTPSFLAKSTNKKDWAGKSDKRKYMPGSKFVSIKKRCKKFPYCNQGDIKALKIYENEQIKKIISNISKKLNINENTVKSILEYEIELKKKK